MHRLALVLVNGPTSSEYYRIDISPAGVLSSGQYLVAHQPSVVVWSFSSNPTPGAANAP